MNQLIITSLICIISHILIVSLIACLLNKYSILCSTIDRWLLSITLFNIGINLIFTILSLFPISRPIVFLGLPLTLLIALTLILLVNFKTLLSEIISSIISIFKAYLECGLFSKIQIFILISVLIFYLSFGMLTVPQGIDELAYHAPQAIGIIQEGRVRTFNVPPEWVLNYPQGAAVLWAWTMLFTGSDILFRYPQFIFGLQLIIGTGLLTYRSGASKSASITACLIITGMPIFYRLVTTIGADLGYNSGIILSLAFLAPKTNTKDQNVIQDFSAAIISLSQSILIKIPITACLAFMCAFIGSFIKRIILKNNTHNLFVEIFAKKYFIIIMLPIICAWSYILNFIEFNNPLYPLTLRIAGKLIFQGPLGSIDQIIMGHSTFGAVSDMSIVQRWHGVFADWFQPINEDAFGGAGPLFLIFIFYAASVELLNAVRKRDSWIISIGLYCIIIPLIPGAYLPRYSLAFLCVLTSLASITLTKISRIQPINSYLISFLSIIAMWPSLNTASTSLTWLSSIITPKSLFVDRGRSLFENLAGDKNFVPSPGMLKAIRKYIRKDDIIVYTFPYLSSFMWNNDYSNKVMYLNPENSDSLLLEIDRINPDFILIKTGSNIYNRKISDNTFFELYADNSNQAQPEVGGFALLMSRKKRLPIEID